MIAADFHTFSDSEPPLLLTRRHAIHLAACAAIFPEAAVARGPQTEVRDALAKRFTDDGTVGGFVAFKVDEKLFVLSDNTRPRQAILPASTFKIPNSIIALESGVVKDPDKDVFKWDGTSYAIAEWNKDHTLRSAIAASAVPVYQEIARRVGPTRMQSYVDAFDYGNHDIGGGIDRFWLTGNLRISPMQQIAFLDKLRRRKLPVSKRSQNLTCDILPVTKVGDSVIRAKSGLIGVDDRTARDGITTSVGWLVGWAEKGSAQTVFAMNLDIRDPKHTANRMAITQQLLGDIGAI